MGRAKIKNAGSAIRAGLKQQSPPKNIVHRRPFYIPVVSMFLRSDIGEILFWYTRFVAAHADMVIHVGIILIGAEAEILKNFIARGHDEFHSETGKERQIIMHIGADICLYCPLRQYGVGNGGCGKRLPAYRPQTAVYLDYNPAMDAAAAFFNGNWINFAGYAIKVFLKPLVFDVPIIIRGGAPHAQRGAAVQKFHPVEFYRFKRTVKIVESIRKAIAFQNGIFTAGYNLYRRKGFLYGDTLFFFNGDFKLDGRRFKTFFRPYDAVCQTETYVEISAEPCFCRDSGGYCYARWFFRL